MSFCTIKNRLKSNEFLTDYDAVNNIQFYEINNASNGTHKISISFESFNRNFNLTLKKTDVNSFYNNLVEINAKDSIKLEEYLNSYVGFLDDEPQDSLIEGVILDGSFYGSIKSKLYGKYYIEPSRNYDKAKNDIIYHEDHIILNDINSNQFHYDDDFLMESQSDSDDYKKKSSFFFHRFGRCGFANATIDALMSYEINDGLVNNATETDDDWLLSNKSQVDEPTYQLKRNEIRPKRLNFPGGKSVCNMYLKVDPFLYEEIYRNEGNQNDQMTIKFLLVFLNKHVEFLNNVFGDIKFFDSEHVNYYQGLKFMIHRTKLITFDECNSQNSTLSEEDRVLCQPDMDVLTYLKQVSKDDFSDYCLGFTFTARDFSDGTLGLAWLAETRDTVGGTCKNTGIIRAKSYNTGLVTVTSHRSYLPEISSQLAFAHEVGHSLGANHDPINKKCSPGKTNGGNYLMYHRSNSGAYPNNRLISQCSLDMMGNVMHALVKNSNKFCFKEFNGPLCGNGVLEEGEECDCGFKEDCDEDCCFSASEDDESKRCHLKPDAACSPSQGICCNKKCQFKSSDEVCRIHGDCMNEVNCTGNHYSCPINLDEFYKPDFTLCEHGTRICQKGKCEETLCKKFNLTQCFFDDIEDKSKLCLLSCKGEATNNVCKFGSDIPEMTNKLQGQNFTLQPGMPCLNGNGFCDIRSKCRLVNYEGPLSKILLNGSINYFDIFSTKFNSNLLALFILLVVVFFIVYSIKTPIDKRKIKNINKRTVKP